MPHYSEGSSSNITYELLALERLFDDPKLLKYKQLIILALRKDVQVQRLVYNVITKQKDSLGDVTTESSNAILDALLQSLSSEEHHQLTLLPYIAPRDFDIQKVTKILNERLHHNRYRTPPEFTDRIRSVLHHASNLDAPLPRDLLYSVYLFIMNHTTANDKEKTKLKRQDTLSEKFLQAIEYEIKRRTNQ